MYEEAEMGKMFIGQIWVPEKKFMSVATVSTLLRNIILCF
jgi:hypothetical protein